MNALARPVTLASDDQQHPADQWECVIEGQLIPEIQLRTSCRADIDAIFAGDVLLELFKKRTTEEEQKKNEFLALYTQVMSACGTFEAQQATAIVFLRAIKQERQKLACAAASRPDGHKRSEDTSTTTPLRAATLRRAPQPLSADTIQQVERGRYESIAIELVAEFFTERLLEQLSLLRCPPSMMQKDEMDTRPLYMVPRRTPNGDMAHAIFCKGVEAVLPMIIRRSPTLFQKAKDIITRMKSAQIVQKLQTTEKGPLKTAAQDVAWKFLSDRDERSTQTTTIRLFAQAMKEMDARLRKDTQKTSGQSTDADTTAQVTPQIILDKLKSASKDLAGTEALDFEVLENLFLQVAKLQPHDGEHEWCTEFDTAYHKVRGLMDDKPALFQMLREGTGLPWPLNEIFATSLLHADKRFNPADLMGYYQSRRKKSEGALIMAELQLQVPYICRHVVDSLSHALKHPHSKPLTRCSEQVAIFLDLVDRIPPADEHALLADLTTHYQAEMEAHHAQLTAEQRELMALPLAYLHEVQRLKLADSERTRAMDDGTKRDPKINWRHDPLSSELLKSDHTEIMQRIRDLKEEIFTAKQFPLPTTAKDTLRKYAQAASHADARCSILETQLEELDNQQNREGAGMRYYALVDRIEQLRTHARGKPAAAAALDQITQLLSQIEARTLNGLKAMFDRLTHEFNNPTIINDMIENGKDKIDDGSTEGVQILNTISSLRKTIANSGLSSAATGRCMELFNRNGGKKIGPGLQTICNKYTRTDSSGRTKAPLDLQTTLREMHSQYQEVILARIDHATPQHSASVK